MMSGFGLEATGWMLLTMIITSIAGIVVMGAFVWIVHWAVTSWWHDRQERVLDTPREQLIACGDTALASVGGSRGTNATTEESTGTSTSDADADADAVMLAR